MERKILVLVIALLVGLLSATSTIQARLVSSDKKIEVEGSLWHQSMWRIDDPKGDTDYIMGRSQADFKVLYHFKKDLGPIDKIDLYGIIRGVYDSVYDLNDDWGEDGGFFDSDTEKNIQRNFNLREAYADIELGDLSFRLGRQQIVWGKTDFFRLLDIVNPMDYSWHFFFESFDDIRIPLKMAKALYSFGDVAFLRDLSLELIVNPDDFEPTDLGRFGMPWALAPPGFELIPTDKPDGVEFGGRMQAKIGGFSFTLNGFRTYQDDPVFDLSKFALVHPQITITGGAVDYYDSFTKCVFRLEGTYTPDKKMGIDFTNAKALNLLAANPDGIVGKDELKYCIGIDRPTFIRFLNPKSTFFLSAQLFMVHVLDYEKGLTNDGAPTKDDEATVTFLANTNYMSGRLFPVIAWAYDVPGSAHAILSSVQYLISNHWDIKVGANIIWGKTTPYASFGEFRYFDEIYTKLQFSF